MKNDVTVRVEEDASIDGIEVIIKAEERSALVEDIVLAVERCASDRNPRITVYQGNSRKSLSQQDIIRIYTENRKLIVRTVKNEYVARNTLRDLEEVLDRESFVRISRFEIVNMTRVEAFDFSLSGTIKITFEDESSTYVARRYVHLLLSGVLGMVANGSSVIYEIEEWSIVRATITHFIIAMGVFYVIAFTLRWFSPADPACWIMSAILVFVYFLIWMIQSLIFKHKVKRMNEGLRKWKSRREV